MDHQFDLLHNASVGVKGMADTNGVTGEGLAAQDAAQTHQLEMQLQEKLLQELLAKDPNSTVSQAGHQPQVQKVFSGPPRDVIVMPKIHWKHPACYSESWWTRSIAPVPRSEVVFPKALAKPQGLNMVSVKDLQHPAGFANFPIHFDKMLGYREFLS